MTLYQITIATIFIVSACKMSYHAGYNRRKKEEEAEKIIATLISPCKNSHH